MTSSLREKPGAELVRSINLLKPCCPTQRPMMTPSRSARRSAVDISARCRDISSKMGWAHRSNLVRDPIDDFRGSSRRVGSTPNWALRIQLVAIALRTPFGSLSSGNS